MTRWTASAGAFEVALKRPRHRTCPLWKPYVPGQRAQASQHVSWRREQKGRPTGVQNDAVRLGRVPVRVGRGRLCSRSEGSVVKAGVGLGKRVAILPSFEPRQLDGRRNELERSLEPAKGVAGDADELTVPRHLRDAARGIDPEHDGLVEVASEGEGHVVDVMSRSCEVRPWKTQQVNQESLASECVAVGRTCDHDSLVCADAVVGRKGALAATDRKLEVGRRRLAVGEQDKAPTWKLDRRRA
jgi:hypothetical protein